MKMNMMLFKPHFAMGQGKVMEMVIWSAQVLLALAFGMAGYMKTTMSVLDLNMAMPWSSDVPLGIVRFIGACELLGALGVLLPSLTRIRPQLTMMAADGLLIIMFLATFFHLSRGEYVYMPIPMALGCLAGFVAWARGVRSPIEPKPQA